MGCETKGYCKYTRELGRVGNQKLQKLLLAYKDSDLGTQVSFRSINGDIPGTIIFKYVFWAFAPSTAGFAHSRPVISIDGIHLYGKYK